MGFAERDYNRQTRRLGQLTPAVKWLLIANGLVYLLNFILIDPATAPDGPILAWGAYSTQSCLRDGRLWELLTFQFLHYGPAHIIFNSVGLFFFGPWMERWWGARKFLVFYLLCGAAGALFFSLLEGMGVFGYQGATLVGASAGIYGILMGVAVIAPSLRVALIFPPVEMSMRQLALLTLAIAAGSVIFHIGNNVGGEAGHLGGAILGFLLTRYPAILRHGNPLSFPGFRLHGQPRPSEPKLRPRPQPSVVETPEVDAILEKMVRNGADSLTDDERQTLLQASRQYDHDRH